ncbi:MAG: phosphoribosylformylglycinamidine cyclo-ligase [Nanoarchaeota archaeon]|nr:phosphoribosylformylglycinamidine cyclo-ligase [Nanoarchaeota archaeon]
MSTYKEAGVDIDAGNEFVKKIKPFVKSTWSSNVHTDLSSFAALYKNGRGKYLVASTDGVGTKVKVAFKTDTHDTIGIDLVAMCANDVLTIGAKPLFFLDYIACGNLYRNHKNLEDVVKGISVGCMLAGCSLIGGETAEMPSMYGWYEYDLAGFVVGEVKGKDIISGANIKKGDRILGLESSGLHSNGYSLVRKIFFDDLDLRGVNYVDELGKTVKEELLEPTRIYAQEVLAVNKKLKGIANITGGGFIDNIPRALPKGLGVEIKKGSWPVMPIFDFLQDKGNVAEEEMYRTFNMGIGMVFIVDNKFKDSHRRKIENLGTKVYDIGKVVDKEGVKLL